MRKLLFIALLALISVPAAQAQSYEYQVVTTIESIVPNGLGRSRMIYTDENRDYQEFSSMRSEDKKEDKRNKSKRSEIRVKNFEETKLLNFFNLGGIRFQNIAANDALISSKINTMSEQGWILEHVASGVESAGKGDNQGIFITRFIFKRAK